MDISAGVASSKRSAAPYIVEPLSAHTHSLILLHGLGSNGKEFGSELLKTGLSFDGHSLSQLLPGARFIFPTAKRRRSSAFSRSKLTQWFDIASLDDPSYRQYTQLEGLEESLDEVLELLSVEVGKVSAQNVLLGGLSQGMAMSAICLLYLEFSLGGFIGMSGWLPYSKDLQQVLNEDAENDPFGDEDPFDVPDSRESEEQEPIHKAVDFIRDLLGGDRQALSRNALATPVFLGHGMVDEKIVPDLGENACDTLREIGFKVLWRTYQDLGHWYKIPEEIDDILAFMRTEMKWPVGNN
ncbi:unnamed protein product [Clonostachys rhizophaga]|uniref:Phospholipase/carboxylesterase/thioesterase domain-containing protein n=1 Tax=Clonostachys rhizophaga TaxID=160324 RepID=A0A9N9YN78_9HYPO|nr:unnamed protein product [Clonostachys rhizophaga]